MVLTDLFEDHPSSGLSELLVSFDALEEIATPSSLQVDRRSDGSDG